MFFSKKIKDTAAKKHKVSLRLDFNNSRGDFLKQKNVARVRNSVVSTFGFVPTVYNEEILRAVFRKGNYLVAVWQEHGVSAFNDENLQKLLIPMESDCIVSHVEYQGETVFSCTGGTYSTADGRDRNTMTRNYYPSLAVCYDRVFGVSGNGLCMTDAGDISSWDDTRRVTSHTKLDAVVALDKIYVLGDTCYTFTPSAEEIDGKFAPFCYGIGAVQTESVIAFGKRAIFATAKGLYELKKTAITPIFSDICQYVSFDGCVACAYKGKYVVLCKRKDTDSMRNDILLVLDVDSEQITAVLDVQPQHISVVDGILYAVFDNKLYVMSDECVETCYVETVDFGSSDVKYLDKLTLRTQCDVDVWIGNGSEKRRYSIKGKNSIQSVPLAGSGRQFTVEVQARNGLDLDLAELTAHSYEV